MNKKLTPKQEKFCNEYLIDLNASAAARRAGYSKRNADKIGPNLIGKSRIAEKIQKTIDEQTKRTLVDADYVINNIKEEVERCKADPDHNSNDIYKGCELLGKHLGLFTDKKEVSQTGEIVLSWMDS